MSSAPRDEPLTELIYNSPAHGPAIHSYHGNTPEKKSLKPELIYVSQVYGPAIYSYERPQVGGKVKVFPILFD